MKELNNREYSKLENSIMDNGTITMLKASADKKPKRFEDFRELVNLRANKRFSPSTVSIKLKELAELGMLKRVLTKTRTGRIVVGYVITQKGIEVLGLFESYNAKLKSIFEN